MERINNYLYPQSATTLPGINPFNEDSLDVEATFTCISSNQSSVIIREGFFYQAYIEDYVNADWILPIENPYPIRVRFAPPTVGEWKCEIAVKFKNVLNTGLEIVNLPPFFFNVIESGHPGYVTRHPNNKNLMRGGELIYPVGHSFPGPYKGVNIYPNIGDPTNKAADLYDWKVYHDDIHSYVQDYGGKYIRTTEAPYCNLLEFEHRGNYFNRLHYAWEDDKLLDYCEEQGVLIYYNLLYQYPIMKYGQYDTEVWDFGHYNEDGIDLELDNDPSNDWIKNYYPAYCYWEEGKEPYEMFLDNEDMHYHKQRTRYYIARYGYSPQIYAFELISESWHLNEHKSIIPIIDGIDPALKSNCLDALNNYVGTITWYNKEYLGHKEHLLAHNTIPDYQTPSIFTDYSVWTDDLDIISFNPYSAFPDKMIITKLSNNNDVGLQENSIYATNYLFGLTGKLIFFSEFGFGDEFAPCSGGIGPKIDVMTHGFVGAAGYYSWDGYSENQEYLWPWTITAQNFLNGSYFKTCLSEGNGNWIQGRQAERHNLQSWAPEKSKELQYYISENRNYVIGYVFNRTYNYYTKRTGPPCSDIGAIIDAPLDLLRNIDWQDGANLFIEGLLPHFKYHFQWFDFNTGNEFWTTIDCMKAKNNGAIKFKHPTLAVEPHFSPRPLIWFYAELDQSCNKSLDEDEEVSDHSSENQNSILQNDNNCFSVSPNPAKNVVSIWAELSDDLILYDSFNRIICIWTIEKGNNTFDVSNLSRGIYILVGRKSN